jgi:uncharacterized protein with NRDE domain
MCLILFAWKVHPDYPLVVAANRDEFYARPTALAAFWSDAPAVLAGRDLEAGGTWMGLTCSGRFAALTNYRAPEHHLAGRPSRGRLVADFLTATSPALDYLEQSSAYGRECNGYNLLVGDGERLGWASNVAGEIRELTPGIYGLSNHLLDTPWPKVGAGRTALTRVIEALPDQRGLFELLADDAVHPDHALPQTGVSLEWERLLSAAFIRSTTYGTRSSAVVCIGDDGFASLEEQTWLPGAVRGERRRFRFSLERPLAR